MSHQYRKKPVVIEAMQFQRRNSGPVPYPEWFDDAVTRNDIITHNTGKWNDPTQPAYCEIITLEGVMRAEEGDWVIRGVKGELYPCKPDIFAATYEDVAARELDVETERPGFQTRMGPQGDDPIPAWWYHLHAAAEALADHGCEANAADVRDIANNLLDQAAPVSTEQAGDAWISVEDRLPPEGEPVLTYGSKGVQGAVMQYTKLDTWQIETASEWHSAYPPTHWMPLPAAPSPNNSPVGAAKSGD